MSTMNPDPNTVWPAYFSIALAATYAGTSTSTIRRAIDDGTIRARCVPLKGRTHKMWRVSRAELDRVFGVAEQPRRYRPTVTKGQS